MATGNTLVRALQSRTFGTPQSLDLVLSDAAHRRAIIPLTEFENSAGSIYSRRWLPKIPGLGDVVWWTWRQLGLGGGNGDPLSLPRAEWVVPGNLEVGVCCKRDLKIRD
jgi:hypothetical protein